MISGSAPWGSPHHYVSIELMSLLREAWDDWHSEALCARTVGPGRTPIVDPDAFFAERSSSNRWQGMDELTEGEQRVKALCARCPVRERCLRLGLDEETGIWGGTMPHERERYSHEAECQPGSKAAPRRHRRCRPVEDIISNLLDAMDTQAVELGLIAGEVA